MIRCKKSIQMVIKQTVFKSSELQKEMLNCHLIVARWSRVARLLFTVCPDGVRAICSALSTPAKPAPRQRTYEQMTVPRALPAQLLLPFQRELAVFEAASVFAKLHAALQHAETPPSRLRRAGRCRQGAGPGRWVTPLKEAGRSGPGC